MCGIFGYAGTEDAQEIILQGLEILEYRGYDSAGLATKDHATLTVRKSLGKIANLRTLLETSPCAGGLGIGHTRWATHGGITEKNCHPHGGADLMIVHNGIIENHADLRADLLAAGYDFASETDTEVAAHLIHRHYAVHGNLAQAVRETTSVLEGSFALCVLHRGEDRIVATRRKSPMAAGLGPRGGFIGSDAIALSPFVSDVCYLEDDDILILSSSDLTILDRSDRVVERPIHKVTIQGGIRSLAEGEHHMHAEILEQPEVLRRCLAGTSESQDAIRKVDFRAYDRILMTACGTAFYACEIARSWFETFAGIPVDLDIASELRYREPPVPANTLAIVVSQSGETADTLAALEYLEPKVAQTLALVNVPSSSIARKCDIVVPLLAGAEIGVASTKAFSAQLALLASLSLKAAEDRGHLSLDQIHHLRHQLRLAPDLSLQILDTEDRIRDISQSLSTHSNAMFLGRGQMAAVAREGALKLKEISYIHAASYPAGEMKHGPIALIDENLPVIFLAPENQLLEKSLSNMNEILARRANILFLGSSEAARQNQDRLSEIIPIDNIPEICQPIIFTIPLQLLAYHTAIAVGADVDRPRNLAKAVTTE